MRPAPRGGTTPVGSRPTRALPLQHQPVQLRQQQQQQRRQQQQQQEVFTNGSSNVSSSYTEETSSYESEESSEAFYTPSHEPMFLCMPLGPGVGGGFGSIIPCGLDRDGYSLASTFAADNHSSSLAEFGMGCHFSSLHERVRKEDFTNRQSEGSSRGPNNYSLIEEGLLSSFKGGEHHPQGQEQEQWRVLTTKALMKAETTADISSRLTKNDTKGAGGSAEKPTSTSPTSPKLPSQPPGRSPKTPSGLGSKSTSRKLAQSRLRDAQCSANSLPRSSDKKERADSSTRQTRARSETRPPTLDTWDPILPEMQEGIFQVNLPDGNEERGAAENASTMRVSESGALRTAPPLSSSAVAKNNVMRRGELPVHSDSKEHVPEGKASPPPTVGVTMTTTNQITDGKSSSPIRVATTASATVAVPCFSMLSPSPTKPNGSSAAEAPSLAVPRSKVPPPTRGVCGGAVASNQILANLEVKRRAESYRRQSEETAVTRCKVKGINPPKNKEVVEVPQQRMDTLSGHSIAASTVSADTAGKKMTTMAAKSGATNETTTARVATATLTTTATTATTTTRVKTTAASTKTTTAEVTTATATKTAEAKRTTTVETSTKVTSMSTPRGEGVEARPPVIGDQPRLPKAEVAVPLVVTLRSVKPSVTVEGVESTVGPMRGTRWDTSSSSRSSSKNRHPPTSRPSFDEAEKPKKGCHAGADLPCQDPRQGQDKAEQPIEAKRNWMPRKANEISLIKDEELQRRRVQRVETNERAGMLNLIVDEQQNFNRHIVKKGDGVGNPLRSAPRPGVCGGVERQRIESSSLGPTGSVTTSVGGTEPPNISQTMSLVALAIIEKLSNPPTSTNGNASTDKNINDEPNLANADDTLVSDQQQQQQRRRQRRPLHGRWFRHRQLMELPPSHSRHRVPSLVTSQVIPECVENVPVSPSKRNPRPRKQFKSEKRVDPRGTSPAPESRGGRGRTLDENINPTTASQTGVSTKQNSRATTGGKETPITHYGRTHHTSRIPSLTQPCEQDAGMRSSGKSAPVSQPHTGFEVPQQNGSSGREVSTGSNVLPALKPNSRHGGVVRSDWMRQSIMQWEEK